MDKTVLLKACVLASRVSFIALCWIQTNVHELILYKRTRVQMALRDKRLRDHVVFQTDPMKPDASVFISAGEGNNVFLLKSTKLFPSNCFWWESSP